MNNRFQIAGKLLAAALLSLSAQLVGAADMQHHHHASPYAGEQTREIKSLSPDDIAELRRGGGWGLARAAELNGVPGPAHLLEMQDAIALDPSQVKQIQALFDDMQARAKHGGERLIALEKELETHFRQGTMDDNRLRELLNGIGRARSELRYIHLSTHLKTPQILSRQQIDHYNQLRGYANPDPCARVPAGHDPQMWRRHNGCD